MVLQISNVLPLLSLQRTFFFFLVFLELYSASLSLFLRPFPLSLGEMRRVFAAVVVEGPKAALDAARWRSRDSGLPVWPHGGGIVPGFVQFLCKRNTLFT